MNDTSHAQEQFAWLLNEMVGKIPNVTSGVLVSADGLLMAKSDSAGKDDADKLAAMTSSLQSLAHGVSAQFGYGPVLQNFIEMELGYLFASAAGHGAVLAVLAQANVDVTQIGFELNRVKRQVGEYMSAAPRATLQPTMEGR